MTWHLDPQQVRAYSAGAVDGARGASVEAHLLACGDCRSLLADAVPTKRLESVWDAVQEGVDSPRRSWVERALTALRVPAHEARLLAAAPSLQRSWLLAVTFVLAFAAAAATADERGQRLFLVVAPLVPVVGVAGSYGRFVDATYETVRATPYPAFRLLLLRVAAVVTASLGLTAPFAVLVADGWVAAAWLLPSLAMVGVVLVLARSVDLPVAVAAAGVVMVYLAAMLTALRRGLAVSELFAAGGQLVAVIVLVGCLALLVLSSGRRVDLRRIP